MRLVTGTLVGRLDEPDESIANEVVDIVEADPSIEVDKTVTDGLGTEVRE